MKKGGGVCTYAGLRAIAATRARELRSAMVFLFLTSRTLSMLVFGGRKAAHVQLEKPQDNTVHR